ncbi:MAG: ATP-grasp domain-containing protein, partial [Mesorhizobium sp.]
MSKILVANRSEIAIRVFRAANELGLKTVAIWAEEDKYSLHRFKADESYQVGRGPHLTRDMGPIESYLSIEEVIRVARLSGADAIHPGYGLLSESPEFAEACAKAGIIFIGPKPDTMRRLGNKVAARNLAIEVGVPVIPATDPLPEDIEAVKALAKTIGYPVMLKASWGGGGRGMRAIRSEADLAREVTEGKREAKAAFGKDEVYLEKLIERARHVEVQVLGDIHGNAVHLFERECSIQRRNQKIVEEAPSPFLDAKTRKAMGEQSVALARAVDYQSAGTVEFIVDGEKNFYFLEMNTRLQVEHPVTELVTGIDLVEQMIRIAAGEKLAIKQSDVKLNGWAVESRLYAEDPYRNFLPSIGRLTRYRPPEEGRFGEIVVRNDTGVTEGSEISMFYDPIVAKLCTWAPTRLAAIDAMSEALDSFVVDGIEHNMPFLAALMQHPRWREGLISTAFISEEYPDGFAPIAPDTQEKAIFAAIATAVELLRRDRLDRLGGRLAPHSGALKRDWVIKIGDDYLSASVLGGMISIPLELHMSIDGGKALTVASDWRPGDLIWRDTVGDRRVAAQIRP